MANINTILEGKNKGTKITDKCKQERTGGDGILNET